METTVVTSQWPTTPCAEFQRNGSGIFMERRVSSTILSEELLESEATTTSRDGEIVRYIEVPLVEEVVKEVVVKKIVEVEKIVPIYETEWVERIVEVPQITYIDKHVEVEEIQEIIREIKVPKVVDVEKIVTRSIPRVEHKVVERRVEIPGEIIEVPKRVVIENKVMVTHFVDTQMPIVVAQSVHPYINDSEDIVDVDVMEYEPEIIQVDMQVPKPLSAQIWRTEEPHEMHRVISIPNSQYNSLLKVLNPHLTDSKSEVLPYLKETDGSIQFLSASEGMVKFLHMPEGKSVEGHEIVASREVILDDKSTSHKSMSHKSIHKSTSHKSMSHKSASRKSTSKSPSHGSISQKSSPSHKLTSHKSSASSSSSSSSSSNTSSTNESASHSRSPKQSGVTQKSYASGKHSIHVIGSHRSGSQAAVYKASSARSGELIGRGATDGTASRKGTRKDTQRTYKSHKKSDFSRATGHSHVMVEKKKRNACGC